MSYWSQCGLKARLGRVSSVSMRILITGGFGFVGGRLAVHLAQAGHQVVLGSRSANSSPAWLPQAEVVQIHWDDERALLESCNGIDAVIHAAGMNAQNCASNPVAALEFNGVATARLVAAACRASVRGFIYLSTAHVYVNPLVGVITEESCPRNLHPYATSHLAGEQAVLRASEQDKLEGIVLRLSNAFGAPVHRESNCWMLLVNDLCKQAVQTRKLILHTNGRQQRDFIALSEVSQVVDQLLSIMINDHGVNGVLNIGSGVSDTVLSMANLIQRRCLYVLGYEPELHLERDEEQRVLQALEYKSSRLASLGISTRSSNAIHEIDKLLLFSRATFSSDTN